MPKAQLDDNGGFLTGNLKGLLQEKIWLMENRFRQKRMKSPYHFLSEAEARVLAALRGEELTISEVARRLGVSRQAVHKVISSLVDRKLVELQSIEGNARDKRIVFTQMGEAMKREVVTVLKELEQEIESVLGTRQFQLLKSLLKKEW